MAGGLSGAAVAGVFSGAAVAGMFSGASVARVFSDSRSLVYFIRRWRRVCILSAGGGGCCLQIVSCLLKGYAIEYWLTVESRVLDMPRKFQCVTDRHYLVIIS